MAVTRRGLLRAGAGLVAAGCLPVWVDARPWRGTSATGDPLLVVIFLRGGADGLHLAPPVGDRRYAASRGGLALRESIPFRDGFALHPALAGLVPVVERGRLAVVHAAGSPHPTRSHFEAQDRMEAGTERGRDLSSGWLGRALARNVSFFLRRRAVEDHGDRWRNDDGDGARRG